MKKRKRSMFYSPARHKYLGEIITIASVEGARRAARTLLQITKKARRDKKLRIKRAMVLAANRAAAMRKKRNLSMKERRELKQVEVIYRRAYQKL